jgi:hypothetical protein
MAYTVRPFFFNERSTRLNTSDGEIVSAPARLNSVRSEGRTKSQTKGQLHLRPSCVF